MDDTFWLKQGSEPLFKDLLWSRPENKAQAGKLLIVGGNKFGFAAVGSGYAAAQSAGIGALKVLLPDALAKTVAKILPEADFAPSTPSGSFNRQSLSRLLELAQWSDGVLLAGDFGRNSETAIVLERFLAEYQGQVTICLDGLDYFWGPKSPLLTRAETSAVINLGKLQKLAKNNRPGTPVLHSMGLKILVELLHKWTADAPLNFLTKHAGHYLAAVGGQVSTTAEGPPNQNWQIELGAHTSVWWAQQPQKPLAALSSAIYDYVN